MVNDFQNASSVWQSQRYSPVNQPPPRSRHLKVSTPSTHSILDVPSTIHCGCTSGTTPIFTVRREPAYRPISRRSQALHRRSSFIRQIPSSSSNHVNTKKPSNLFQNQPSLYAKPPLTPAPLITLEQTYRGYASLRNHFENPIKVQSNFLQCDGEQTVKIGTTRAELSKNELDSFENLASPSSYEYTKWDKQDLHDVNNNVVLSTNNPKNLTVSDRPKRPYKMTVNLPDHLQNYARNQCISDAKAQQFTVMPAILAYPPECRKKLRIRRRYQQTARQCIIPCCEPQCHCSVANQGCKTYQIPLKACTPPFEANHFDQNVNQTQQTCRRWRTGCTVRRRTRTPVKEPTPRCCIYACKVPCVPQAENASTGAGPFETQLNSITHPTPDENIQSFTPIKSASTSSIALDHSPSAKLVQQEESFRNFQSSNSSRGLVGRSKSTPSIQPSRVTFPSQNRRPDSNQNITGTRGKSTKQSEKQIRQIYPPQSSLHRPIMAQQATSYSGDKIQENSSIQIGPPSKIPPFSDATAAYPVKPDSPLTRGSSPSTHRQFNGRPSVRRPPSALKSNIKSSSSSKSTRFGSVVQRGSAAMPLNVADELPNSKGSFTRRPTAYPSSKPAHVRGKGSHDRRPTGFPSEKGNRFKYSDESDAVSQESTQHAVPLYESIMHPSSTNTPVSNHALKNNGIMHPLSTNVPATGRALKKDPSGPGVFNEPPSFTVKNNVPLAAQGRSNTTVPFSQQSQKQMYGQPTRPPPNMENVQRKEPFESHSSNYSDRTAKLNVAQPEAELDQGLNYGRPTSLPPKPEPRPPLPPKPHKTAANISRQPPSWRPGGHARKKRPKKKAKDRDSSYADTSDGLACGNMLPLGCFPCGPMMLPNFQAKEGHGVKPDTQNCCIRMNHVAGNSACKPIFISPMPSGTPQVGFNIPQVCIGPSPHINEGINPKHAVNMGMHNFNPGNNGQNTSKPVVTIIPGMVYAPAAAVKQAYGDKLNCRKHHVTGGWKS